MKRTISKLLLTAGIAAVMLSACSKVPEESKYIPKEAGLVLELNAKQISQKLITNGMTMDKLIEAAQSKDTADNMAKAWKDAKNSGIDMTSNFFVSVVFGDDKNAYIEATGSLQDAAKFEAFLKANLKSYDLKTGKDFKYTYDADSRGVFTWNNKSVIYLRNLNTNRLNDLPGLDKPADEDNNVDTAAAAAAVVSPVAAVTTDMPESAAALVSTADHLYHMKESETAGTLEPFKKLLKESADMGFFFNTQAVLNSGMNGTTALPGNFKKLMEGSFCTATANFEKGKILVNTNSYMGKEMLAIFKKYGTKEIDMSMLEKYPSDNVTGFVSYAFDFHMVGEIIKSTGTDGLVNMMLSQRSGLTMDDLLNAFDGQLVYVASDFQIERKPNPYFEGDTIEKPNAKWIFNMKVANKDAFNKVMSSPLFAGTLVKQGDKYVLAVPELAASFPAMSLTEKSVTLGSDSVLLEQYLAGKGQIKLPEGVAGKAKGNMLAGYVDLAKMAKTIPTDKADEDDRPLLIKAQNLFKDVTFSAKKVSGDVQTGEIVLNFKDQDKNSLVQLAEFGTEAAKLAQAKKAQRAKQEAADKAAEDALYNAIPADSATIR
ncbi:MAG: hypothetical protein JO154_18515 [Chitinophaga sp.]|uniref:hypothetical protein n=1 Tax=Chitinophaga sp. TaxID=1869181 RepID=UPI0025C628A8|nr:hypothetical protein [Chitinophaga sp.]MBV8254601.1 hypothetical protein [Chitinophaga sp.]